MYVLLSGDMPSFNQFKADLCHVVALALVTGKQA